MDNPEYTFQILEVFSKVKSKDIPRELEEYISYVARTGDPVFQWPLVKVLIKEKLQAVLNNFIENGGPIDIPLCPNVDIFDYETMKEQLIQHIDTFVHPPFTIQRICELLAAPRKEYNRVDKYMRAVEKNVLVISSSDLSMKRGLEPDANDLVVNGVLCHKVNNSFNSFTNHVFAVVAGTSIDEQQQQQESELNVGTTKMAETDAVQQIIDNSWSEESNDDEFKLNGSTNVSFDHELQQFVTEKSEAADVTTTDSSTACDVGASTSSSLSTIKNDEIESVSSFADCNDNGSTIVATSSTILQANLQNIIIENTNISFEHVSDVSSSCDKNYVDTTMTITTSTETKDDPNDDTYEFKDEDDTSLLETRNIDANMPIPCDVQLLPAANIELSKDSTNNAISINFNETESTKVMVADCVDNLKVEEAQTFVNCQSEMVTNTEQSATTVEMIPAVATTELKTCESAQPVIHDEPMIQIDMDRQIESTFVDTAVSTVECPTDFQSSLESGMNNEDQHQDAGRLDEAEGGQNSVEEKLFSAGDNTKSIDDKSAEEIAPSQLLSLGQQSLSIADSDVDCETSGVSIEPSHAVESGE